MKTRWNRASITLAGDNQEAGSVSVFFDYDLRCWLFGLSFDVDDSWYDMKVSFGPIGLSFTYWRRYVFLFDPD